MTFTACSNKKQEANPIKEEPIELTFFYPVQVGGPLTKLMEALVTEFETENPHITINPIYTGDYQATAARIKEIRDKDTGTRPDFFVSLASDRFSMIDMASIEPLGKFIGQDEDTGYIDGFLPEFIQDSVVNGQIWSIPFQRSTEILYYNKDAFREVGLSPETPPGNWDELATYAQQLTKRDENGNVERWGIGMGLNKGAAQWSFGAFSIQNNLTGENLMSADGKEVFFNTPENIEVLKFWRDLQKKYKVMPEGVTEWADLPHQFLNGNMAMIYSTTGNLTHIFKKANFEFGTAFLPGNKQMGTPTGGGNFYICKDTTKAKQEAAWKFIKFATETENVVEWSINTGYIPTRKDAFETDLMKAYYEEMPQAKIPAHQLIHAKPELATYDLEKIWEVLNNTIHLILNEELSPEAALSRAQEAADEILDKYQY